MTKQVWAMALMGLALISLGWQSAPPEPLLITEVFYDAPGRDETREWVEIANLGTAVLDLSDVKIGDEETVGGEEGMRRFPEGAQIEPGQVIVIAQTAAGFQELYGRLPDYEINDTDPAVPDMRRFLVWSDGDLALGNDGDELLLVQGMLVIDAVSYGDSDGGLHAFSPAAAGVLTGQSLARLPAHCDSDAAADWAPQDIPTPGDVTLTGDCAIPPNPTEIEPLPPIGAIQGDGPASPVIDDIVTFRGVVTGFYEDRNTEGRTFYTLFVQDLPGYEDGDPATSDGMALFLGQKRPSYQPGDQLRITGRVTEFFGYTEIDDEGLTITLEAGDVRLPQPIAITPPTGRAAQAAYFEPLESMLVAIPGAARVVGPTYSGCGFAIVRADAGLTRVFRRSAADLAGPAITILHTSDVHCGRFPDVKSGDGVDGVVGPLIYNFDEFKIVQQMTGALAVTAVPLPSLPPPPAPAADQFSVATMNVENHFDAIDDTGDAAEPKPDAAAIAAKQAKLAHAIGHTLGCPTLIGVQEVEKEALLLALADEVAPICGFTYTVTHRESADIRGIDVALLSDPRRVTVTAVRLRPACTSLVTGIQDDSITCDVGKQPLFSRPPLQATVAIDGISYTLFVNHFKSKRGGEAETAPRRLAQAGHIAALTDELRGRDEDARIIVLGDFNDYEQSPAMERMAAGGLINALLQAPDADRYSFIFGGASQLIDGMLLSANLLDDVTAVTIQHVNADYPFNLGDDTTPAGIAHRATDHDLPLLVLDLDTPATDERPSTPTAPGDTTPRPETNGTRWWLWPLIGLVAAAAIAFILFWRRH